MRFRHAIPRQQRGFTLIELIITVAIIAILAAIALPSFARVIASNRVASGVNEFIAAVNLARTEAVRRNRVAGVCASSGTTCGSDWNDGFLVYYMSDAVPPVPVPVRAGKFSPKDTISSSGLGNKIEFSNRGQGGTSGGVLYKPVDANYVDLQRCLRISLAGSITTTSGVCPT